jgi:predicted small metal-binding protein
MVHHKPSIKCPECGHPMTADTEEELAKVFQKHTKDVHDMDMSHEMALKKVKMAQEGEM